MNENKNINLKNLISAVRNELETMEQNRIEQNKETLFQLKNMVVELSFVVEDNDSTQTGMDLKIIKLGGSKDIKSSEIQKITLEFEVPNYSDDHVIGSRLHHKSH